MAIVLVTGSGGLVGSEAVRFYAERGFTVAGIDNDRRSHFFGDEASNRWKVDALREAFPAYRHHDVDIRDEAALERIFGEYGSDLSLIIHTAAQPSHDWAARDPMEDFTINAVGTLRLLEQTRQRAGDAVFVFTSTNKVYGDRPNALPLVELEERWEIHPSHAYRDGIDETMSIDESKHSLFGASKAAADLLVQEYGRYFDMKTACFRAGCITGPNHSGAQLHGFLAYLMKCTVTGAPYSVFGYKGKQVRDNIHSWDLVNAFHHFYQAPRSGAVYNIGGGRESNCSVLEGITLCEELTGKRLSWQYVDTNRSGDHIWWISALERFRSDYPEWSLRYGLREMAAEILDRNCARWK
ncbi:MAG TPA: NAD-dependent epimerase/dehydratase family protein [Gemmatimonadaceae bacterium]|jgi:CDP-paratose 2-epimerase|nr:NAD-dependent epimerase/dehydratase family protein [Gemmatimonadaceae bacterium]